jgi:anthranilate phosphoribosyltransferase
MKKVLQHLFEHKTFDRASAKEVLINISKGIYNDSEIASFTTVFLMRSITIDELQGFRDALMELCVPINFSQHHVLDIVGTGGDGKNTFNISTLSSFIVAGTGNKVAKHGNYGASSISGSSNVMEQLGYSFTNDNGILQKQLDEANICFFTCTSFSSCFKNCWAYQKKFRCPYFF